MSFLSVIVISTLKSQTSHNKLVICALIIGKFVEMIFLGFIGVSLIECLTNPIALIKVIFIVVIGYVVSVIVNKKFNLDERFDD